MEHSINKEFAPIAIDESLLKDIPTCDLSKPTEYQNWSEFFFSQEADYLNALFYMLQKNGFKRPIKKDTNKSKIAIAFDDFLSDIDRRVVFFENSQFMEPFFHIHPNSILYPYLRPLYNWLSKVPNPDTLIGDYADNPQHFFVYCSHFFKKILLQSSPNINFDEWNLTSEIQNASDVIADALFDAVDIDSYFDPQLACLFLVVSKIPYHVRPPQSPIPYVFENGFLAQIHRTNYFSYNLSYRDVFQITSKQDSICFQPIELICIYFNFPFSCSAIFNEQTIYFDGEKLVLMENTCQILYITTDGVLVSNKNHPVIIDQYGTVSQKLFDTWTSVTADSTTYVNGKRVDRKSSSFIDYKTKVRTMVRPDGVEYYVNPDGTRKIIYGIEFTIEQRPNSVIAYDILNFPLITFENGTFTIQMDRFEFSFSKNKTVKFHSSMFSSEFNGEKLIVDIPDYNLDLSLNECNINSKSPTPKTSFHADATNPNDTFQTEVSKEEIAKRFPMRFFVVRSDLTGVEFIRKDSAILKDAMLKPARIVHPYGGPINILSVHFQDLEQMPFVFIENSPVQLPDDENQLIDVMSQKVDTEKALHSLQTFLKNSAKSAKNLETYLQTEHDTLLREDYEDFGDNYVVDLPHPVATPSPRMLNMQYNLYQKRVCELEKGEVLNYFKSHEVDFAIIENEYDIIEEEEEEEQVEMAVNQRLKAFEITGSETVFNERNVLYDVPPPAFPSDE